MTIYTLMHPGRWSFGGKEEGFSLMTISLELNAAIESARQEAHVLVDRSFELLRERLSSPATLPAGSIAYKQPTDEDCRDPRNKNGLNLTQEGRELLFRLLDMGAGYNSAGRKLSITQSAVKNRKKDWEAEGGLNRTKMFIPYLDSVGS
jgi:DNA invertase Pin-like site-specific DNA recombinase